MKKFVFTLLCFASISQSNAQEIWKKVSESEAAASGKKERVSSPEAQTYFKLDIDALKQALSAAPRRGESSSLILPFPNGTGIMEQFRVYEAPVMHPDLAQRFPGNKSYVGQGIGNRSSVIRFSVTLFGLHAMTLAANNGTSYIDPYSKDGNYYISYQRQGLTTGKKFECHTADAGRAMEIDEISSQPHDNGIYRTYRTGIVTTMEYSAFHIAEAGLESAPLAERKAAVLAAVTITITRVNSMFERDLSVFLQLIPNEDEIIFIDSDNLTNDDVGALIGETQATLDAVIGTANYDFGHGVGTSGGGLGGGQPCAEGGKAFGATGLGSPVGDPFDIDYVAHEMGHQFGAAHTFNNSCGGNRDENWSYEPGSGSSIMAYAGICDPNIQGNSNAQFFAGSIAQIKNTINGAGGSCAAVTFSNNTSPIVNAGSDYIVPKGTALILAGSSSDAEDDALTYMWEQYDREITLQPPSAEATEGPNFKPQVITDVPIRYLPQLSDVLDNNLAPTWEVISTVGREYNFAFTVRDNNINGGESGTDFMKVTASDAAGPFNVYYPSTAEVWDAASTQTVGWNVAGTTENGVNTQNVDIFLSTNGLDFSTPLAINVPNDGTEQFTVPNLPGISNRIMVKGHGNIFYAVNNQNLTIAPVTSTFALTALGPQYVSACLGSSATFTFDVTNIGDFNGLISYVTQPIPLGVSGFSTVENTPGGATLTLPLSIGQDAVPGLYTINISATSGLTTRTLSAYLNILSNDFGIVNLSAPTNNAAGVEFSPPFTWTPSPNASLYTIEIAMDAAFTNIVTTVQTSTNYYNSATLSQGTLYYWRIRAENAGCIGSWSEASSFTTGELACDDFISADVPVAIPSDDVANITSVLNITDNFNIQDATVSINISHTWVGDLSITLISPAGTSIGLVSNECGDNDDISATFSDSGSTLICGGTPVVSGTIKPESPLSVLNGESSFGEWTLQVADEFAEDGGFINSWSLNLCRIIPALSIADVEPSIDFSIYPNPGHGEFTLRGTNLHGLYDLAVFDMRGRKIYQKEMNATAENPTEHISFEAESGIYLIALSSEKVKTVRKLIVK